jgi:hypothetical protein
VSTDMAMIALWLVVLMQGALMLLLYRQVGMLMLRGAEAIARDGPPIGRRLSNSSISALSAETIGAGTRPMSSSGTVILFARPNCGACRTLWSELRTFMMMRPDLGYSVVFAGDLRAATQYADEYRVPCGIVPDPRERLFGDLSIRVVPFAVVIDSSLVVRAKGLANNTSHLSILVAQLERADTFEREQKGGVHAAELA